MGPVHVACLRSFLRQGHRVVLHAYGRPEDTPDGVELFDAAALMDPAAIVRHRKHGSLALASDIYRYRIQRAGLGLYADCDVFCLRPIADADYILGWESERHIASAVLKFPAGSPLARDLSAAADDPAFLPPWDPLPKRLYYRLRKALGSPVTVDRQRWGTIGPKAVTWYVHANGVQDKVSPIDVFSPVRSKEQDRLFDPALDIAALATDATLAIHLRHEMIRRRGDQPIPPTSPLGRMLAL